MRYLHLPWTDNEVSCAQEQILVWTIWNQNCTCVMAVSSYTNPHFRGFFVCLCFLQAQHYRGLKRRREDVEQSVPKGATAWDSVLLTVQQSEGCICYWWNLFQVRSDFERMKKFRGVPPNGRFELKTNITQNWHHQNFFSVCPNHRHLFCRLVADVRTIIGSLWCLRKEKKRKRNGNVNKKKKKKEKEFSVKKKISCVLHVVCALSANVYSWKQKNPFYLTRIWSSIFEVTLGRSLTLWQCQPPVCHPM